MSWPICSTVLFIVLGCAISTMHERTVQKTLATGSRELQALENTKWYSRSMIRDAVRARVAHGGALDSEVKHRVRTLTVVTWNDTRHYATNA
jgi:hypothetical protein